MPDLSAYPALQSFLGDDAAARGQASAATLDEPNPDQAAKDMELAKQTGLPYALVKADSDEIAHRKQKADNAAVLQQYPDLARWMGNNPGAAEVAYDDTHKLGQFSETLKRFKEGAMDILGKMSEAYKQQQDQPTGEWLDDRDKDWLQAHPEISSFLLPNLRDAELALRLPGSLLAGGMAGVGAGLQKMGVSEQEADRISREGLNFAGYMMAEGMATGKVGGVEVAPHLEKSVNILRTAKELEAAKPFLDAGEKPPVGIHPIIDQLHAEEAKADIKNLDEAVRAAKSTALSERNPDLLAALARETTNETLRINSDAVRELYGGEEPTPEDNKLGWVPDIVQQLRATEAGGGYIKVPVAEYVARVASNPELHDLLHDHVAIGDGLTLEEAKDMGTPKPQGPLEGMVRFYHGGHEYKGGPRWLTEDQAYAEGYAKKGHGFVHYVDIPESKLAELGVGKMFEDEGTSMRAPYVHWEAPEEIASQLRPLDQARDSIRQAAALEPSEPPPAEPQVTSAELSDQDFEEMSPKAKAFVSQGPFEKGALQGVMTQAEYNKYQADIARRNAEDIEAATDRAAKDIRRRQTKEWKEREVGVRSEVEEAIRSRPDIAADDFFRKYRIDWDKLNREDADAVAGQFGYQTGEQLINNHQLLEGARGDMNPTYYKKKLADVETDRRMQLKYGDLEENILKEARGQALNSRAQEDVLIDELQAWAKRAGQDGSQITREMVEGLAREQAKGVIVKDFTEKNVLSMVGKWGRLAEKALQEEDDATGFLAKQRQAVSFYLAKEARKYEKERAQLDSLAKRFSNREVKGVDPAYTNFIHQILMQIGQRVKRSVQDLQGEIEASGYRDLASFVQDKEASLREVPVADFLLDPKYQKPVDAHTLEDFRAVHDSLKALRHNGIDEATIEYRGDKKDREALRDKMIDQLKDLGIEKEYPITPQGPLGKSARAGRTFFSNSLQLETLFNRFDKGNPLGIFTQSLMRPLTEAGNYVSRLERKYAARIRDLGVVKDQAVAVENSIWIDPLSGKPFNMTKGIVREVLNHAGNSSNWDKLTKGYGVDPNVAMQWLISKTTPEDWARAQKQGHMFRDLKRESDMMYRQLSGVAPAGLDLQPISNPHGNFDGWYYPVKYDPIRLGDSKKLAGPNALEQEGYFRATTPAGYTKARTGYIGPVDISSEDIMPHMVRQMVHDIAFRPAIVNAGKMFYDPVFRKAITADFGREYSELLAPYLKGVANNSNPNSAAAGIARAWSEHFRQNYIGTLVGLNPGTVLKHGPTAAINSITEVGLKDWSKEFLGQFRTDDATATSNKNMALGKSEELQRRLSHHFQEAISGAAQQVLGRESWRESIIRLGTRPVALSDMLSAVPTWLAKYKQEILKGTSEGDAVYLADRAVRRAHGSSAITNRPNIVLNGGALGQWFSSLYTFFGHILQRQYEVAWEAADALRSDKPFTATRKVAPHLAAGLFSYFIAPALIEQLVSGHWDKKQSWGLWAAEVLGKGLTASWIGARDLGDALTIGKDPTDLLSSFFKTGTDPFRDFMKDHPLSRQHAGKLLQDSITLFGALTGFANAQEGRTVRGMYNYMSGQEHPRHIEQWYHLLRRGTMKEPTR